MKKFNAKLTLIVFAISFVFGTAVPNFTLAAGPPAVDLLSAANFTILSESGITNTGGHSSIISGNIGSSPITSAAMDDVFCSEMNGTIYGVNAAYVGNGNQACFAGNPPLSNKTLVDNAVIHMEAAYGDAAGRVPANGTNLYGGIIGGQTFTPGIYKWTTDVSMASDVTLSGGANDVWIFQITGNLSLASAGSVPAGIKVLLLGGARASNIFWQVGGLTGATLGTYSTFNGNILTAKQIIIQTGAVLNGRALAQTQVTLDANTVTTPASLHIIKLVVNSHGGISLPSDFIIHVKKAGVDVLGSPASGAASPGVAYSLAAGTYIISENTNSSYVQTFSGDCNSSGSITLAAAADKTCTVVNTDIAPPAAGGSGTGGLTTPRIIPLIGVLKVPSPLALPTGSGEVTYNYTIWNVGKQQSLTNISVVDDKCSPVIYLSGDSSNDGKLGADETWKYSCTKTIYETTTNTVIATGYSDDSYRQSAVATSIATVVVGAPLVPPLINIIKVPSRLTPFSFGGGEVTYTYTVTNPGVVAMHTVDVTDDKCEPVVLITGDSNGNNLLDANESWTYTCRANITVSTRNVATAEGRANGFNALGYAFANVYVAVAPDPIIPSLPNTGYPPENNNAPWGYVIYIGLATIFVLSYLTFKRLKV